MADGNMLTNEESSSTAALCNRNMRVTNILLHFLVATLKKEINFILYFTQPNRYKILSFQHIK